MSQESAVNFYRRNYRCVRAFLLEDDAPKKIVLEDTIGKRCRFCGGSAPDVSFRLEAHAIPESLGNRALVSRYECDTCNSFFGSTIENDFGNWSKPMRTFARRQGKKGVPAHKGGGETGWRLEHDAKLDRFLINAGGDERNWPFTASADHRTVDFNLKCDPYVPMGVLKTFVKMGLSILPESELPNFCAARAWIRNSVHQEDVPILAPTLVTFTPERTEAIRIGVLCRKPDAPDPVPYAFLLLSYGYESFQVILPSPERDPRFEDANPCAIPPFPPPGPGRSSYAPEVLELRDTEIVRDAAGHVRYEFGAVEIHDLGSARRSHE
ncbi:HNH endonuclease [Burkholderia stagnalis]|uniref:HNH endonuclease n=1 Tax=Burkholderia stagnalis TaxID=1503054 RepID=UPI00162A53F0|nr:HNH endonuclease [Burkholderia stagnalis]